MQRRKRQGQVTESASKKKPKYVKSGKPNQHRELTQIEIAMCHEYVANGGDQQAAYIKTHPNSRASKVTATRRAHDVFAMPQVRAYLRELMRPMEREAQITGARVLQEVARIALLDPRKLLDDAGNWLPMSQWPAELAACVSAVETEVDMDGKPFIKRVRFWDKNQALEKLMKNKGLFEADNKQRGAARIAELPPAEQDALLRALDERMAGLGGNADAGSGSRITH